MSKLITSNDQVRNNADDPVKGYLSEKASYVSSSPPTVSDDNTNPLHFVGQIWVDTTENRTWVCKDLSTGAANWISIDNPLQYNIFNNIGQDTNVLGAGVNITFGAPFFSEPSFFDVTHTNPSAEITLADDGWYEITSNVVLIYVSGGVQQMVASRISFDGTTLLESSGIIAISPTATLGSMNFKLGKIFLPAGTIVRLNCVRLGGAGTNTTYTRGTWLNIDKLS